MLPKIAGSNFSKFRDELVSQRLCEIDYCPGGNDPLWEPELSAAKAYNAGLTDNHCLGCRELLADNAQVSLGSIARGLKISRSARAIFLHLPRDDVNLDFGYKEVRRAQFDRTAYRRQRRARLWSISMSSAGTVNQSQLLPRVKTRETLNEKVND